DTNNEITRTPRRLPAMKVHVVNVMRAAPGETGRSLDRFARFSRGIEERGFAGLWVTDSFGRGRPTLDPIVLMSVIAAVTQKIEIGTCVLQVPVRHPAELAHRIQALPKTGRAGSRHQVLPRCGRETGGAVERDRRSERQRRGHAARR